MAKISVVINVVDEEVKTLPRALSSVKTLADEIVLIDMTKNKTSFPKDSKVKLYKHKRVPYVELVRNFGLAKAKGDWILILDPDEEISKSLAKSLLRIAAKNKFTYVSLPRKNLIFGKWLKHSRWWPDYNVRFFQKDKVSWDEAIHSVPITQGQGTDLEPEKENAIIHHHYDSIDQFVSRLNRYTTAQAKQKRREGYQFSWRHLITKPTSEFLSRYFQAEGYKDGLHGLALAFLQAFSELVLYLKVWQAEGFRKRSLGVNRVVAEMKTAQKEVNYWQADAMVKLKGGLAARLKRKFKLP